MRLIGHLTIADKLLVGGIACMIVVSYIYANTFTAEGSVVLVDVDGKTVHKASLRDEGVFGVHGTGGQLKVEIHNGEVAITDADCPNHICVRTGWRYRSGDVIVCVPNKTVIRIESGKTQGVRATTG